MGVRRAAWLRRWRRYKRRQHRKAQTTGKRKPKATPYAWNTHRGTSYQFIGDGRPMYPFHWYIKHPKAVPPLSKPPTIGLCYVGGGWGSPPHNAMNPPSVATPPPHDAHADHGSITGQVRSVRYRGHKAGRQNGYQRQLWGAYRYWRSHFSETTGERLWPPWDPEHRTPVDPNYHPL